MNTSIKNTLLLQLFLIVGGVYAMENHPIVLEDNQNRQNLPEQVEIQMPENPLDAHIPKAKLFENVNWKNAGYKAACFTLPSGIFAAYKNIPFGHALSIVRENVSSSQLFAAGLVGGSVLGASLLKVSQMYSGADAETKKWLKERAQECAKYGWYGAITTLIGWNVYRFYNHVNTNRQLIEISHNVPVELNSSLLDHTFPTQEIKTPTILEPFMIAGKRVLAQHVKHAAENVYQDRYVFGTAAAATYGAKKATSAAYQAWKNKAQAQNVVSPAGNNP